jgi:hypothetical protein
MDYIESILGEYLAATHTRDCASRIHEAIHARLGIRAAGATTRPAKRARATTTRATTTRATTTRAGAVGKPDSGAEVTVLAPARQISAATRAKMAARRREFWAARRAAAAGASTER